MTVAMIMPSETLDIPTENGLELLLPDVEIGALAVALPSAARVLLAHGIDFCCFGPRTIAHASRDHFLCPDQVIEQIRSAVRNDTPAGEPGTSPDDVVHYIVNGFLRPLGHKLSAIEALLDKIVCFHGQGKGRDFRYLRSAFSALSGKLWEHRFQKEQVWFPGIISGHSHHAELSAQAMHRENETVRAAIEKIRGMQIALAAGAGRCVSVRVLHTALHALLSECSEQLRLETDVLYRSVAPDLNSSGRRLNFMQK